MLNSQVLEMTKRAMTINDGVLTIDVCHVPEDVKVVILSKRTMECKGSNTVTSVGKLINFSPMTERNRESEVRAPISFVKSPRILIPTSPRRELGKSILDEDQEVVLPDEVLIPQT